MKKVKKKVYNKKGKVIGWWYYQTDGKSKIELLKEGGKSGTA